MNSAFVPISSQAMDFATSIDGWFDNVNQFHGSDAVDLLAFSISVDGRFAEDFRPRIPDPALNGASTPSFWACTNETDFCRYDRTGNHDRPGR